MLTQSRDFWNPQNRRYPGSVQLDESRLNWTDVSQCMNRIQFYIRLTLSTENILVFPKMVKVSDMSKQADLWSSR